MRRRDEQPDSDTAMSLCFNVEFYGNEKRILKYKEYLPVPQGYNIIIHFITIFYFVLLN